MVARLLKLTLSRKRFVQLAVGTTKQFRFLAIKALIVAIAVLQVRTPPRFWRFMKMFGTKENNRYFKKSIIIFFICPNLSFKSFKLSQKVYINEIKDFAIQLGRTTFSLQKLLRSE